MIPKIIHYCWFGTAELPHESKAFITEWKNLNPDWTIILWNEANSPMDAPYMQKAHQEKMWANMSNFIRLHALKEQGGIYMDTDVKLIKPLDTLLNDNDGCFFGFEEGDENSEVFWINNAISGAVRAHPFILECYASLLEHFDGTEMSNLSGPRLTTELLKKSKGLTRYGYQHLADIAIYPKEFFYPIHYSEVYKLANLEKYLYPETVAVHVWARTWLTRETLLHIIDDLYESNHQQQLELTRLLSYGTDGSSQNELLGYLKQIAGNQYFYSRAIRKSEEELLNEKSAQIRLLADQNAMHLSELNATREKIDLFLHREKELTEWISDLREVTKTQSAANIGLTKQVEILTEKEENLRDELRAAENKALQAALFSKEQEELQQKKITGLQNAFGETQDKLNQVHDELSAAGKNLDKTTSTYDRQVTALKQEIQVLNKNLAWYHQTFEQRSLAGVIKDRIKRSLKKKPQTTKSAPRSGDLQTRIRGYIDKNHLTVKRNSKTNPVSIIMLSYNRIEDTQKAIKNIYKYTTTPFELIILDNNSTNEVKDELKQIVNNYENMRVILETVNLGCAKGRMKAKRYARYEYLLFLDNDILVQPYYLENLFSLLYKSEDVAGVCCKVVFPNGKIQFNGGKMVIDDEYALYSLYDEGAFFDEAATNRFIECEWIPGGATLWKKDIFNKFGIDEGMKGSFEDNEISYRLTNAGYKLLNSPASIVIHDHYDFKDEMFKKKQSDYYAARNDAARIQDALIHFYRKHHLIFSFAWKNNPWDLIWGLNNKEDIKAFIQENSHQP